MEYDVTVFSPDAVSVINRAYLKACNILVARGDQNLRDQLAGHVMHLALDGEMDEERLCRLSVLAVLGRTAEYGVPEQRINSDQVR